MAVNFRLVWAKKTWVILLAVLTACGPAAASPGATASPTGRGVSILPSQAATSTVSGAGVLATDPAQELGSGVLPPTLPPSNTPTPTMTPTFTPTPDPRLCLPPGPPSEVTTVAWVVDGDTIVVNLGGRLRTVRYLGIDAPAYLPSIRFMGPPAFNKNQELTRDTMLSLYQDGPDTDSLGQLLRYVVAGDVFVNYELVRQGLAKAVPADLDAGDEREPACAAALLQAESQAQAGQVGVWSDPTIGLASATLPVTAVALASTPVTVLPTPTLAPASPTTTSAGAATLAPSPTLNVAAGTPTLQATASTATLQATVSVPTEVVITPNTSNATATPVYSDLYISYVFSDGDPELNEADEYIEISNDGTESINLTGWSVVSVSSGRAFVFPAFTIGAENWCVIYTNYSDEDSCVNASFDSPQGIWGDSDCARLYNADGNLEDEWCY